METDPISSDRILTKNIAVEIRLAFVRKVYAILTCQLLLTAAIAAPIAAAGPAWVQGHQWFMWVGLAIYLVCSCAAICCRQTMRTFPWNYTILGVLTIGMSIMVGFISAMYTWQSVVLAAGVTSLIFLCLTIFAWKTSTDFTGFGPYLFAFAMTLLVFGLVISILSMCGIRVEWMIIAYDVLGVLLFSCYIVFDTQMILGEWGGHKMQFLIDDYCMAALQLYLDIINLFLLLLELFGRRR
mmetsp:Transcript_68865/g.165296  ORF Transcript_68865/g.165296 Transcript_68865/m.165296 type:complete len:240 (+) Transcript_68865:99-818(+)|eukprot:CAMPEP_0178423170 /NCGR_PEP_ID=MMETSP0689_2-20121128/27551_1 /TAXON_ID=160604 /ORGANISM="Amphidinium massartii, Strain CS-259" /LENGTH=239 /DNA_ID=CAMNT_0020044757 /DNA_START=15 /DNA_END=734 /DNA_ORIENTATION=+